MRNIRRQNRSYRNINKNQVALKTKMCRAEEFRVTLKRMWIIIPGRKITNYSPNTITVDTPKKKDAKIRKSDIAIATENIEKKPRLIESVACKTMGKYNRNRAKIRKFYFDEQKEKEKIAQEEKAKKQEKPSHSGNRQQ